MRVKHLFPGGYGPIGLALLALFLNISAAQGGASVAGAGSPGATAAQGRDRSDDPSAFPPSLEVRGASVAGAGSPGAADNDRSAKQWLEKMIHAVNNLNYQGTFIYLHDNQLETMQIVHQVSGGKVRERLISLNGAPREVIRDQESVTCVIPDSQSLSVDKRPFSKQYLALLPEDLQKLDSHYRFRWLGKGRVAGQNAKVVAIIPKDGFRYGYRFFLDEETALPLKSDLMNERGKAVEQTMFTQLEVGIADIKELPSIARNIEIKKANADAPLNPPAEEVWTFQGLPDGFGLSMRNTLPDPHSTELIEQYVLTDGLASLSIFVESAGQGESLKGVSRLGAINAWGGEVEGYQVTAVGEVPAVTLLGVVDAMRLKR